MNHQNPYVSHRSFYSKPLHEVKNSIKVLLFLRTFIELGFKNQKKWRRNETFKKDMFRSFFRDQRIQVQGLNLLKARNFSTTSRFTMAKAPPSDLPIQSFSSANEFENYLNREHTTAPGLYLKLAKKASGIPSVSAAEAVELALCFGWIDGRANAFDNDWWLVRYTPRRPKSIWSQKNVNTIERLLKEGRMRPAGVVAVEAAKADGRWERAYAGPATITVPDDFATALAAEPAAAAFFEGMNKSNRYSVLWRVQTASTRSRAQRIESLVQMLADGKRPGAPAKPGVKPNENADTKKAIKRKAAMDSNPVGTEIDSAPPVNDDRERQPRRAGLRHRT